MEALAPVPPDPGWGFSFRVASCVDGPRPVRVFSRKCTDERLEKRDIKPTTIDASTHRTGFHVGGVHARPTLVFWLASLL
jgi:hypothetical protein